MTENSETSVASDADGNIETDVKATDETKLSSSNLNNVNNPLSIRVLQVLIQFILASLFTTSAFLISLQAKQLWYQYQYNAAFSLTEKTSSQYVHHFGSVWYKLPSHASDHFEFSNGRLKVNTSLYAF